jgi:hypothetical protein
MATSKEFQREQQGDVKDYAPTYKEEQPKQSESYKVYHDKTEASKSGVIESQPDGLSRELPKSEAVTNATVQKGKGPECARKQLGENLKPINSHEKEVKHTAPNN